MSAQHTPGPWRVVEHDNEAYILPEGDSPCVTGIALTGAGRNYTEALGNARLIASAPDLLDALTAIQCRINGEWDNPLLMKYGPLSTDTAADCFRIAGLAITKVTAQ
jgi:hypothetical protein